MSPISSLTPLIELLYRALDSEIGIVVAASNVERVRAKFYAARREAQNPAFEDLSILPSRTQPEVHLWIVRKTPSTPATEPTANGPT